MPSRDDQDKLEVLSDDELLIFCYDEFSQVYTHLTDQPSRDQLIKLVTTGQFPTPAPPASSEARRPATQQTLSYPLQVFLCHASEDKAAVKDLYYQLQADGVTPWLDELHILPGQTWRYEIPKAVRSSDVILVCLSNHSVSKAGYVQKEIKDALDVADEQPEGTIFIIPLKLEECEVPDRLSHLQWVNLFDDGGYNLLIRALQVRAETLQTEGEPTPHAPDVSSPASPEIPQRDSEPRTLVEDIPSASRRPDIKIPSEDTGEIPIDQEPPTYAQEDPPKTLIEKLGDILSSSKWQGIAGFVAVLTLCWAVFTYGFPSLGSNPIATVTPTATATLTSTPKAVVLIATANARATQTSVVELTLTAAAQPVVTLVDNTSTSTATLTSSTTASATPTPTKTFTPTATDTPTSTATFTTTPDAEFYHKRASAYMAQGEIDLAVADIGEAIRLDPDDAEAYYIRGFIYLMLVEEPDLGIADISEAIRLDPDYNANAYYIRGTAYEQKGEYDRAIDDYEKVLELNNAPRISKSAEQRLEELRNIKSTPAHTPTSTKISTSTATATKTPTGTSTPDDVPMFLVPAGAFEMGSESHDSNERPVQSVILDAFYIDQYEVTNGRYKRCVEEGICDPPKRKTSRTRERYYSNPEYDNYPVIWVSWEQAKTYCEWRGGRLPTEAEWEKAARGTDGRIYPWGNEWDASRANTYDEEGEPGDVTPVGAYPEGVSPYGAYDMAGNVWEFTQSLYRAYPYDADDGRENLDDRADDRVLRGGSWILPGQIARASFRGALSPDFQNDIFGFRCAAAP